MALGDGYWIGPDGYVRKVYQHVTDVAEHPEVFGLTREVVDGFGPCVQDKSEASDRLRLAAIMLGWIRVRFYKTHRSIQLFRMNDRELRAIVKLLDEINAHDPEQIKIHEVFTGKRRRPTVGQLRERVAAADERARIQPLIDHVRLPAESCAVCDKTLEEVGGSRVAACMWFGVGLVAAGKLKRPPGDSAGGPIRLDEDLAVVFGGSVWDDEPRARAVAAFRAGRRPWLCQGCARKVCETCGAPLPFMPGTDVLDDDGRRWHHMIAPGGGCKNPRCAPPGSTQPTPMDSSADQAEESGGSDE